MALSLVGNGKIYDSKKAKFVAPYHARPAVEALSGAVLAQADTHLDISLLDSSSFL